ncbi:MAG: DEAD/DEAH box helicase [Acholeplasmatales bacterium]|nr:MAG: DEAD/DEAH box helicase [Acholeplasmatales bacterium]
MEKMKPFIKTALEALGFERYTEVQNAVIPAALAGRDLMVSSQTGTGKTHAYLIPIFEKLVPEDDTVSAVIMSPTRELATQIEQFARQLAEHAPWPIRIGLYTGGKDRDREVDALKKRQPHVVIGTPGRIRDLTETSHALAIHKAKTLVIDEADMTLESGFLEAIEHIYATVPANAQMMVFSATLPESLRPFLKRSMRQPLLVDLVDHSLQNLNLTHTFIKCTSSRSKDDRLKETVANINPYLAIIFANKKEDVERLGRMLYQDGVNVVMLHGDLPPRRRKQILNDIRRLKYQYVVASDMASRGIDLVGVSHIINYDLPKDMAFFVHRIGRSGRMGQSGETISYFTDQDAAAFAFIDKHHIPIVIQGGARPEPLKRSSSRPSSSTTRSSGPGQSKEASKRPRPKTQPSRQKRRR